MFGMDGGRRRPIGFTTESADTASLLFSADARDGSAERDEREGERRDGRKTWLHQPARPRRGHVFDMTHHRLANRSHLPRCRPQEAHANVIERLAQPNRIAAQHFHVVGAFLVAESESQPADGAHFQSLTAFDETTRATDVYDRHEVLTHQHRRGTAVMYHPRLTCCSNKMRAS